MRISKITKKQQFMLFILGQYYRQINHKFKTHFLKVTVSKVEFIDIVKKSGIVSKQARAIYKNLEDLEKNRLIEYTHHLLKFRKEGIKEFERINKDIQPYLDAVEIIKQKKILKSKEAGQMIFWTKNQPKIE